MMMYICICISSVDIYMYTEIPSLKLRWHLQNGLEDDPFILGYDHLLAGFTD